MIEHFISVEENGREGALGKAQILIAEGYAIKSIQHMQVPQAGSASTPYAKNYGQTELGYYITVDSDGYPDGVEPRIPPIIG